MNPVDLQDECLIFKLSGKTHKKRKTKEYINIYSEIFVMNAATVKATESKVYRKYRKTSEVIKHLTSELMNSHAHDHHHSHTNTNTQTHLLIL